MNDQANQTDLQDQDEDTPMLSCHHCGGTGVVEFGPNTGEMCCHCEGQGTCEESSGSASCCAGAFGAGYNG